MTDDNTAHTDIRRRQREIADRVLAAGGNNGDDRTEVNAALEAAGLPVLENEAERISLHDNEADSAAETTIFGTG